MKSFRKDCRAYHLRDETPIEGEQDFVCALNERFGVRIGNM